MFALTPSSRTPATSPPRLLVFCKEPRPGAVKTRLAADLGPDRAAEAAWAFLADACAGARAAAVACGGEVEVHHAPAEAGPALAAFLTERRLTARPQVAGDLGARMAAGLAASAGPRLVIGSDVPDLGPERILAALRALERAPGCLIPAPDGGYVLLGLAAGVSSAPLREPIRWSSAAAAADTQAAFARAGAPLVELESWSDVDELADLVALAERLAPDPSAAPQSAAWISAALGPLPWRVGSG